MKKEKYLEIWNSVWEEDLSEIEVQKRYLDKLKKVIKKEDKLNFMISKIVLDKVCLLYTSPSPRDLSTSRMPSSA